MMEISNEFTELIYPVFCNNELYGTSFYISIQNTPILFTAKHVIEKSNNINILKIDMNKGTAFDIPIQERGLFNDFDIGYIRSKFEVNYNSGFKISESSPNLLDKCWMAGFQGSSQSGGNVSLKLYRYEGSIVDYLPNGTGVLKNPCYQCDYFGESGSSGGPVFNISNEIIGIHSTGFKGSEGLSFFTPFYPFLKKTFSSYLSPSRR